MAGATLGAALRQIHRLFDEGGAATLGDGQLLERFVVDRDEAAFEALVGRHGPMVLGTARAVLKDSHAAEDAFQAAFVALARRARTIRGGEALGGWLHRVAYREAVRAGSEAGRRRAAERRAAEARRAIDPDLADLRATVHAEVDRLPEAFRLPVVLCDLQGLTKGQAAHHLGWTEATVRGRLERARRMLRDRLSRRGFGLTFGLAVAAFGREAVSAEAVGAARLALAVRAAIGTAPRWGLALASSGARLKAAALAAVALVGLAAAEMAGPGAVAIPPPPRAVTAAGREEPRPPGTEPVGVVEVRGRVLDPDGRPVAGATVRAQARLPYGPSRQAGPSATTGPEGRFALRGPRSAFEGAPDSPGRVVASAPGFGLGLARVVLRGGAEATVRLARDDVPIEGRVVDLEGRPVAGASVRVAEVWSPTAADLSAWAEKVRLNGGNGPYGAYGEGLLDWVGDLPGPPVLAGPDGRFRVVGIGRERLAGLIVAGPGIETAKVHAMTRPGEAIATKGYRIPLNPTLYHPARFDHAAAPARPVEGVVTDRETGRPLAGVAIVGKVRNEEMSVSVAEPDVEATTDAEGHYRLPGLPRGALLSVIARPGAGLPYPTAESEVPDGLTQARLDLGLKRGVVVRGRVTEKGTGRPVPGARVQTYAFADDPALAEYPGYAGGECPFTWTDADGRFAVAALPGRGLLAAHLPADRHLAAGGVEAIPGYSATMKLFRTKPSICYAWAHHAIAEIRPGHGAEAIDRDLEVDPGRTVSVNVVDPEGKPLPGATSIGIPSTGMPRPIHQESATFEATGLDPAHPRRVSILHDGRKLAGWAMLRGDEPDPVTVRLRPWAAATGRVVDAEGQPLSGKILARNLPDPKNRESGRGYMGLNQWLTLEPDGRFRVEGLMPGLFCRLHVSKDFERFAQVPADLEFAPGEVKDVGDLVVRPEPD